MSTKIEPAIKGRTSYAYTYARVLWRAAWEPGTAYLDLRKIAEHLMHGGCAPRAGQDPGVGQWGTGFPTQKERADFAAWTWPA